MPVDSGGNVTRPPSPLPVTGQTADAPQVNVPIDDIYSALNQMVFLDGRKSLRGNIPMNGYRARNAADAEQPQDYVTLAQLTAMLSGIVTIPTGIMVPFSGTVAPAGWVITNGGSHARATFPNLWAFAQASGNLAASEGAKTAGQYGPGDGSTTFTVPNLTDGAGYFLRSTATGRTIGSVQADEFKSHGHAVTITDPGHGHSGSGLVGSSGYNVDFNGFGPAAIINPTGFTVNANTTGITASADANGGTETRPRNIAYPFIIKA